MHYHFSFILTYCILPANVRDGFLWLWSPENIRSINTSFPNWSYPKIIRIRYSQACLIVFPYRLLLWYPDTDPLGGSRTFTPPEDPEVRHRWCSQHRMPVTTPTVPFTKCNKSSASATSTSAEFRSSLAIPSPVQIKCLLLGRFSSPS